MVVRNVDEQVTEPQIRQRREAGADRHDEVWDGVYFMSPMANDEHQDVASDLTAILKIVVQWPGHGRVREGVNVSDRVVNWRDNFRCPDVVVYLNETAAVNHGEFWFGGPDLAVEVVSPRDRSREKFDFYAAVGTREVLVVDRYPWLLELYRLTDERLNLVGTSSAADGTLLTSETVPLSFRLVPGDERPQVEVVHRDGLQRWTI